MDSVTAEMVDFSHSPTIGKIAEALSKAQAEMKGAIKDSANPHLKNKYADLASVWDAWRTCGPKYGLAVTQPVGVATQGMAKVYTFLMHTSGEWIRSTLTISYEGNKGVNMAQAMGSALTYGRRYALAAMVGIAPEDDDGANAGPPGQQHQRNGHHHDEPRRSEPPPQREPTLAKDQRDVLAHLAAQTPDKNKAAQLLLVKFKVKAVAEIPAKHFEEAATILRNMAASSEPATEDHGDAYEGEPANLLAGEADYPG